MSTEDFPGQGTAGSTSAPGAQQSPAAGGPLPAAETLPLTTPAEAQGADALTVPLAPVPPAPAAAAQAAPADSLPAQAAPTAAAPSNTSGGAPISTAPGKPRPRTSPIVFGALILVFCAYVAVRAAGGSIDPIAWLITTILGLGALLLLVGVAVLVRGSRDRR